MNQKTTLSSNFKSSRLQMFFKIGVLKNFAIFAGKQICWSNLLIKLQAWRSAILLKETLTLVFSCEYCKIFNNTYFEKHLRTADSVLLIMKLIISIGHLFLIKNMMGWFLLRKFVDLVRVYSLLIIRNHSNTFLLVDLQKNRIKVNKKLVTT